MNPFSSWTPAMVAAFNARVHKENRFPPAYGPEPEAASGSERELHDQIWAECRRHGWIALHGAMSQRTHRTLGEPDFVILANDGRVFFIEVKTRKGKLSTEQAGLAHWASTLGHTIHVVRSLEEFLALVKVPVDSQATL